MDSVVVRFGSQVQIYSGDDLAVSGVLPVQVYEVVATRTGLCLQVIDSNFAQSKIYGPVRQFSDRVVSTFMRVESNIGVLFSGPTGLGKSLSVRYIAAKLFEQGVPVIWVKSNFSDLTPFFDSIHCRCVVIFDEFEKLYSDRRVQKSDDITSQEQLLSVFDSHFKSNKLFMVTVNDINHVSDCLLNRPGRLHYHYEVRAIGRPDIKEYCADNLLPRADHDKIVRDICKAVAVQPFFSYDMLHAIVMECNMYPEDSIEDIVSVKRPVGYEFLL